MFARRLQALADGEGNRLADDYVWGKLGLASAISDLAGSIRRRDESLSDTRPAGDAIRDSVPDPIILLDRQHRIVRVNAAAKALLNEFREGTADSTLVCRDLAGLLRHAELLRAIDAACRGRGRGDLLGSGIPPERTGQ